jgi:HNH endonuclease
VKKSKLTQERLHELLRYDPRTGKFRWRVRKKSNHNAGDIAGCRMRSEYWAVHIDGRRYPAHQLAYLYMEGKWGRPVVDHRDGNPLNNRWRNLRLSTHSENAANRMRMRSNTSGFKGVVFDRRRGKWRASITKQGRHYPLGSHATADKAHAAYVVKARELYGEFARTK